MDDFELSVDHGHLDESVGGFRMIVLLPRIQFGHQGLRGRWDEIGFLYRGAWGADPVLDFPKPAPTHVSATHVLEKYRVELQQQVEVEWLLAERLFAAAERLAVVDDFLEIPASCFVLGFFARFEFEDFAKSCLCAFYA